MAEYRKYSLKQNRIKRSFFHGFEIEGENTLCCREDNSLRWFISDSFDGIEEGATWGRLHIDWELEDNMSVILRMVATDEKVVKIENQQMDLKFFLHSESRTLEEKIALIERMGAKKTIQKKDVLLQELKGRYFYFIIEVRGIGNGRLSNIFVNNKEDIFNDIFQEECQKYGSAFDRYISVFSTLYTDFQEEIENVTQLLDIETAPVELLSVFGQWMGLEIRGDFLPEENLRKLMKEAYKLSRIKGTRTALERVCEIVLGEKVIILEKKGQEEKTSIGNNKLYDELYGSGEYDVTVFIQKQLSLQQKSQLMFFLNQFKPVRTRLNIKALEPENDLDGCVYLDMNASVQDSKGVVLDDSAGLDCNFILAE